MDFQVPGYRLDRLIAEGGMASVYLAVQESLSRKVALKLLKKFDAPAESERFINEGRIISSLNHRNIITIHDIGMVGERPFISMEYLDGGDLEQRIEGGIETDAALDLLQTIGECLEFVHKRGIIHRDIKPANILFHDDGTPILTDFGIAKELQTDTALTMDGTALGSPHYLSPEQAECKPLSGRADIYSLGVVLYQMLTGKRPYDEGSAVEVMVSHLTKPVPRLPASQARYQPLLDRMMAKAPEARFASAADMLACIRELRDAPVAALGAVELRAQRRGRGSTAPSQHHRRLVAGVVVIGLGLALLVAVTGTPMLPRAAAPSHPEAVNGSGAETNRRLPANTDLLSPPSAEFAKAEPRSDPVLPDPGTRRMSLGSGAAGGSKTDAEPADLLPPQEAPVSPRQRQLQRYLESARTALAEYRLTTPHGDNAHFYLQRALELAPGNREARRGIVAIADAYADLVEGSLAKFAYADAKRYLARGLRVQPDNERLLALQSRTEAHRDVQKRLVRKLRSWF